MFNIEFELALLMLCVGWYTHLIIVWWLVFLCTAPTYDLLVGNGNHLSLVHFEGTVSETVRSETTGNVVGVDFHAA